MLTILIFMSIFPVNSVSFINVIEGLKTYYARAWKSFKNNTEGLRKERRNLKNLFAANRYLVLSEPSSN